MDRLETGIEVDTTVLYRAIEQSSGFEASWHSRGNEMGWAEWSPVGQDAAVERLREERRVQVPREGALTERPLLHPHGESAIGLLDDGLHHEARAFHDGHRRMLHAAAPHTRNSSSGYTPKISDDM